MLLLFVFFFVVSLYQYNEYLLIIVHQYSGKTQIIKNNYFKQWLVGIAVQAVKNYGNFKDLYVNFLLCNQK